MKPRVVAICDLQFQAVAISKYVKSNYFAKASHYMYHFTKYTDMFPPWDMIVLNNYAAKFVSFFFQFEPIVSV